MPDIFSSATTSSSPTSITPKARPNMEGQSRRRTLHSDKAVDKALDDSIERFGETDNCSRSVIDVCQPFCTSRAVDKACVSEESDSDINVCDEVEGYGVDLLDSYIDDDCVPRYGFVNVLTSDDEADKPVNGDKGNTQYGDSLAQDKVVVLNAGADQFVNTETEAIRMARKMVEQASELLTKITGEIESANDMLNAMKKPKSMIPQESMGRLKIVLESYVKDLFETILRREKAVISLTEEVEQAGDEIDSLRKQLDEAQTTIEQSQNSLVGLTDDVKFRLEALGFECIEDLVNKYFHFQDRVEQLEKDNLVKRHSVAHSLSSSRQSINLEVCHQNPVQVKQSLTKKGMFSSCSKNGGASETRVQLPLPEKFHGKTRVELERFFDLYEAGTKSRGWGDTERATYLGSYIPELQLYHDSLRKRGASYEKMKIELLNSLGIDGSVALYSKRGQLDRLTKPPGKPYKQLFKEVELLVTEAYGSDVDAREGELKKILLRITEEDRDPIYRSVVITNVGASYYKLKELVVGLETSQSLQRKVDKVENKQARFQRKIFLHLPKVVTGALADMREHRTVILNKSVVMVNGLKVVIGLQE